ncbi:MAG: hypothetical protein V3W37_03050 [Candidatus Binatia bacterium]
MAGIKGRFSVEGNKRNQNLWDVVFTAGGNHQQAVPVKEGIVSRTTADTLADRLNSALR